MIKVQFNHDEKSAYLPVKLWQKVDAQFIKEFPTSISKGTELRVESLP